MTLPNAPYRKPEILGFGHVAKGHRFASEVPHAGRAGGNAFGGIVGAPEEGELGRVAVGFVVKTVAGGHRREFESVVAVGIARPAVIGLDQVARVKVGPCRSPEAFEVGVRR